MTICFQIYYESCSGEFVHVADVADAPDRMRRIFDVVNGHIRSLNPKYKVPYIRMWNTLRDGVPMTQLDVGSHTEFFYVKPPVMPTEGGDSL